MSYVKEFLVPEEESVEEQEPTLADDIRSSLGLCTIRTRLSGTSATRWSTW